MKTEYAIGRRRVEVVRGSITTYPADALVCPANADLEAVAFPGGVQYAFVRDGGVEIFEEAKTLGEELRKTSMDTTIPMAVPETSAHITGAGRLPARHVIHSVAVGFDRRRGSLYCNGNVIARSTKNALDLAKSKRLKSVGFPALGTGLYQVPLEEAAEAMGREFAEHLRGETTIDVVGFVLYSPDQYKSGKRVFDRMFASQ